MMMMMMMMMKVTEASFVSGAISEKSFTTIGGHKPPGHNFL